MKKLINRIFSKVKSIKIDRDRLESFVPYLVPEYWASNKKSSIIKVGIVCTGVFGATPR